MARLPKTSAGTNGRSRKARGGAVKRAKAKERRSAERRPGFKANTIFQVQLGVALSAVEEEIILGDLLSNRYFRLNETGAFIWRHAISQSPFDKIVRDVAQEYALDPGDAEEAVSLFLSDAVQSGVLVNSTEE